MRPTRSCVINSKKQDEESHDGKGNKNIRNVVRHRGQLASCHTTPEQLPRIYLLANPTHIEHEKVYEGRVYYKVHFDDQQLDPIYLHKNNGINLNALIKDFIARGESTKLSVLGELEWEVEDILDSVVENGKTKFLVKWKHWIGDPTWLNEDDCDCSGLIALYENPKLKRIRNFNSNNRKLWITSQQMQSYIKRLTKCSTFDLNLLDSTDETCELWPEEIEDGLNIGCTMYDHHWFVVFIFRNSNCVTQTILLADSLNTTVAQKIMHHPILVRLRSRFPGFPIRPIKMTQMDRSDMCAFYCLAAIERAMLLFNPRATFIPETIEFHPVRAEFLRSKYAPFTNNEITISLRSKVPVFTCPTCEFCREEYLNFKDLDKHIEKKHFRDEKTHQRKLSQSRNDLSPEYNERLTQSFHQF